MPNTLHLIEQVRRKVPNHTDYAVAKALEMQQGHLLRILAGKAGLGPKAVMRLAEILQRDVRDILVLAEEDKATRPKDRDFWERRSPRITATIAIAILAFGLAVTTTARALDHCASVQLSVDRSIHYAKYYAKYFLTFAKYWFLGIIHSFTRFYTLGAPAAKPSVTFS